MMMMMSLIVLGQRMSSAANAPLCNIRERKQCNLLSYFPAPQQLYGTRKTCSKMLKRADNHNRAPEPIQVISCQRPVVKCWSGQAGQSFEILCGPTATLGHPQLRQTCDASIRPHWTEAEGTQGAQALGVFARDSSVY